MLPDQSSVGELATDNALVEGATFLAILIGTITGGLLVSGSAHTGWVASAIVLLAVLSWASASRIPHNRDVHGQGVPLPGSRRPGAAVLKNM